MEDFITAEQRNQIADRRIVDTIASIERWYAEGEPYAHGFWLSFVDVRRPEGEGDPFLGGCFVRAPSPMAAPIVAKVRGCNPGGEVQITDCGLMAELPPLIQEKYMNRLLTRAEIEQMDREVQESKTKGPGTGVAT